MTGRYVALGSSFAGGPPQIEAVTPDTDLVTLTCGGHDVGYIGRLMVDYLTIRPPDPSVPTGRLPAAVASWGREVAYRLSAETRAAAEHA